MNRKAASKARQAAMKQIRALSQTVQRLIACKKEIIPGKTTTLLVKCGKKNCRCVQGVKHTAHFLYVSRGGPLKRIWIPRADLKKVKENSERYRRLRANRAKLTSTFKALLDSIDQLEAALSVPYEKRVKP